MDSSFSLAFTYILTGVFVSVPAILFAQPFPLAKSCSICLDSGNNTLDLSSLFLLIQTPGAMYLPGFLFLKNIISNIKMKFHNIDPK